MTSPVAVPCALCLRLADATARADVLRRQLASAPERRASLQRLGMSTDRFDDAWADAGDDLRAVEAEVNELESALDECACEER